MTLVSCLISWLLMHAALWYSPTQLRNHGVHSLGYVQVCARLLSIMRLLMGETKLDVEKSFSLSNWWKAPSYGAENILKSRLKNVLHATECECIVCLPAREFQLANPPNLTRGPCKGFSRGTTEIPFFGRCYRAYLPGILQTTSPPPLLQHCELYSNLPVR